jgi:hypothetical protein
LGSGDCASNRPKAVCSADLGLQTKEDGRQSSQAGPGGAAKDTKVSLSGFQAVGQSLKDYAATAMDWGKGLGETLTGAFSGAESAFRSFVETGKLDFKSLVRSILADLAVLAFKNAVLGPIANALSGVFGGGSAPVAVSHNGGMVGLSGMSRRVPTAVFAGAPRMHSVDGLACAQTRCRRSCSAGSGC